MHTYIKPFFAVCWSSYSAEGCVYCGLPVTLIRRNIVKWMTNKLLIWPLAIFRC